MPPKRARDVDSSTNKTPKRVHSHTLLQTNPIIKFSSSSLPPDVEITIFDDIYHLHSANLRHNSPFFDKGLSATWWKELNSHDGEDGIRYRYRLKLDEDAPEMSMVEPVAKRQETDSNALPIREDPMDVSHSSLTIPEISMTEAPPSPPSDVAKSLRVAYSALFKIFYNRTSDLSFVTLSSIQTLVSVADQYCALPHVSGAIELLLIKWSRSHGKIHESSLEVLLLATKIRSKVLYNDAFVHIVGQFSMLWKRRQELPEEIRDVVMEEYHLVSEIRTKVDREVARFATTTRHDPEYIGGWGHSSQVSTQLGKLWKEVGEGNGEGPLYRGIEELLRDEKEYDLTGTSWRNKFKWLVRT
ncbi:hypothetical protein BDD12DRAFT_867308 [Trichophaea hybrida]|nr:hypothetical protein BDD12DRAFT_867308 [Trichophaea hybrida]